MKQAAKLAAALSIIALTTVTAFRLWLPSIEMTINPAVISDCGRSGGRPKINVRWDATAHQTAYVRFTVNSPGMAKKGWTKGGLKGSLDTGPWGRDGMTITMHDDMGNVLARRTVESYPCNDAS